MASMNEQPIRSGLFTVCVLLIMSLLSACDNSGVASSANEENRNWSGKVHLTIPERIRSVSDVRPGSLFAIVTINGETQRWEQNKPFNASFRVDRGDTLTIDIRWYETLSSGLDLLLAAQTVSQVITDNTSLDLQQQNYQTTGAAFDQDEDNYSNLLERTAGSDPADSGSTPLNIPLVRIQRISPLIAPRIDGVYDSIWDQATGLDIQGEPLAIDNLMIERGAVRENGQTQMRWLGMHDDEFLYLYVFGDPYNLKPQAVRDSVDVWQDDALNVFIDGDYSYWPEYDGFDDRHLMIPMLTRPDDLTSNNTFFSAGYYSADLPVGQFDFASCDCQPQRSWELRLRLEDFNILKNRSFGLELQIEVDHDGGSRDAKWGWYHPAKSISDVDNTWRSPQFMGVAIIE